LLVDARRGLEQDDRELITFVDSAKGASRRPVEVLLVATKIDKLARSARKTDLMALERAAGRKVVGYSSVTGEGRAELWRAIRKSALGQHAHASPQDPGSPGPRDQNG